MARNTLRLDTSGFDAYIRKLDSLGGDVRMAVNDALGSAADKIEKDTRAALAHVNLPAKGRFSSGDTEESIVTNPNVEWDGTVASIPVGFDFNKPGAGGFLITGTPRMKPDYELQRMYKQKRYMAQIQNQIGDALLDAVHDAMEGH